MAKATLETLKAKKKKMEEAKKEWETVLASLSGEVDELKTKIADDLAAEDTASYERHFGQLTDKNVRIDGYTALLSRPAELDDEDVISVWNDYVTAYNRTTNAKIEAYKKAKKALYELYYDLAKGQSDALRYQREIASLRPAGMKARSDGMSKMVYIPSLPNGAFFEEEGRSLGKAYTFGGVTAWHMPSDEL